MLDADACLNTISFKTESKDWKGLVLTLRNGPLINITIFNACAQASLQDYWGQIIWLMYCWKPWVPSNFNDKQYWLADGAVTVWVLMSDISFTLQFLQE